MMECYTALNLAQPRWFNPFTATLAALSLLKPSLKGPTLKLLKPFVPFALANESISIKMHSIESKFDRPSDILLGGVYVGTFQPGNIRS